MGHARGADDVTVAALIPTYDNPRTVRGVVERIRQLGEDEPRVGLALSLHAPWRQAGDAAVAVNASAPGLVLSASRITVPGTLSLRVDAASRFKGPAFFRLTLEANGVLPVRRWVKAV